MNILRHPATLARPGASRRRKGQPPETFLNVPLLAMCVGAWGVIFAVAELLTTLF